MAVSLHEAQADIYGPSVVPRSQEGPLELDSGLFLLTSHAKLPCLPWYGTLGWCQAAVRSFIRVLEFGDPNSLTNPASIFSASAPLLIQVYMKEAVSPSFLHDVLLPLKSQFMPGCHRGKHIFLVQGRIQWPASPSFGSTYVKVRKRSRKPSQGNSLAHTSYFVTAILLQSPSQCQVLNILFSFFLTCLCSRPVVPIVRRILLIRQSWTQRSNKKNHINKSFAVPHYMTSRGTVWPRHVYWSVVPPFSLLRGFLYDHLLWRTLCHEILKG